MSKEKLEVSVTKNEAQALARADYAPPEIWVPERDVLALSPGASLGALVPNLPPCRIFWLLNLLAAESSSLPIRKVS